MSLGQAGRDSCQTENKTGGGREGNRKPEEICREEARLETEGKKRNRDNIRDGMWQSDFSQKVLEGRIDIFAVRHVVISKTSCCTESLDGSV